MDPNIIYPNFWYNHCFLLQIDSRSEVMISLVLSLIILIGLIVAVFR